MRAVVTPCLFPLPSADSGSSSSTNASYSAPYASASSLSAHTAVIQNTNSALAHAGQLRRVKQFVIRLGHRNHGALCTLF